MLLSFKVGLDGFGLDGIGISVWGYYMSIALRC